MDYSTINRGIYPVNSLWRSKKEKLVFSMMTLYIIGVFFYLAVGYTFGDF